MRRRLRRYCLVFNHDFIEENNPSERAVTLEEELNGTDIDDIGSLENLAGLVFIVEECWDLKVVNDGGELARGINQKRS